MRSLGSKSNRSWFWPLLLTVAISVASGRSKIATPGLFQFDKAAHFLVFGLLATLVVRLGEGRRAAWLALLVVSLYGMADEWHQSFTPGRSVELADWMADTAGAALAVMLYACWPRYRAQLETPLGRKARVENPGANAPSSV
ncbi:VanZ family protein [Opitutus terrae]|uniref:VanZ family protein n=1 Tax=Opitutus terrae (strain DSM 11246 / JCM 15787 / PB90-1) TaxID=452637 RepID=B1ZWH3_OPITP|nr:VanZ family protein [Opitutus terrae]ACB73297.1 VanZ family protein [Opitutus terrae PB90-1]